MKDTKEDSALERFGYSDLGQVEIVKVGNGQLQYKQNTQIVGNIGLYWSCYKLSKLGWNVMPTARNARGVDIIAYNSDASAFKGIQVKALSKRNPVPLGLNLDKAMGDFWIIVVKVNSDSPTAFIMKPEQVKRLAHRGVKEGKVSYWLQPTAYDQPEFREAWHLIGHGGLDAQPSVPPASGGAAG